MANTLGAIGFLFFLSQETAQIHVITEDAIINSRNPGYYSLGLLQEAHVFETKKGECAIFLSNMDFKSDLTVQFRNLIYVMPAWSISILPYCKAIAFNTTKVSSQSNNMEMLSTGELYDGERWESFKEQIRVSRNDYF